MKYESMFCYFLLDLEPTISNEQLTTNHEQRATNRNISYVILKMSNAKLPTLIIEVMIAKISLVITEIN